jgi:general secretion pathway protein D
LGRLKTLTILLTLGAWAVATDGALGQDASAPPGSRQQPPAPPGDYVKAGVQLYQKGNFPTAAKYFKAASDYRDLLKADEQATLDQYMGLMSQMSASPPATGSPAPSAAPATSTAPSSAPMSPAADAPGMGAYPTPAPTSAPDSSAGAKQKGRWLLHQAREQIRLGNFDDAAAKLAEARAMNIKWSLFDETPDRMEEYLNKARAAAPLPTPADFTPGPKGDKRAAQARLKEAKKLISAGQYEQADAIAREVAQWGHHYNMWEESPYKVASAARALRQRDQIRKLGPKGQPSQEIYDIKVQEARSLLAAGRLDEAESKARDAQTMNVVAPVTADRAEAVLHDIALKREQGRLDSAVSVAGATAPAAASSTLSPSEQAEREANALLNQNQVQAAQAKFQEAARLKDSERGLGSLAAASADPSLMKVDNPAPNVSADPFAAPGTATVPIAAEPAGVQAPAANSGQQLLDRAKALMIAGSFGDAKQAAQQAKASGAGLDAPADAILAQIALAEQSTTVQVYDAALSAMRKQDYARARALLEEMSGTDLDEATRQKVEDLLARLQKEGKPAIGPVGDAQSVNAQRVGVEVGTRVAEARRLMETDPEKAIDLLQKSLESVKTAGLSEPDTRNLSRRLEVQIELAKKDKITFDAKMKDKEFRAEIERKRLRILEADKAKKEQIKALMTKAQEAMSVAKYDDAEVLAKRASEIDPNDPSPVAFAHVARLRRRYETDLRIRDEKDDSVVRNLQGVDAISYVPKGVLDRDVQYNNGFGELSKRRDKYERELQRTKSSRELAIEAKLNESIPVNFDKTPLSEAVDFLAKYTGLNIALDTGGLMDAGVTEQSPVTLKLKDVPLKNVLRLMLKPTGLTYRISENVLLLTNPQVNRNDLISRYYYVGDLALMPRQGTLAPAMNPAASLASINATSASVDANGQPVNGQNPATGSVTGSGQPQGVNERPNVDFGPLINIIKATVAPGTWKNDDGSGGSAPGYGMGAGYAGGGADAADTVAQIGTITPFFLNISLIIRHTAEVHDEIVDLLRQLRRLQDLQVSIEVRFITVSDSFFEQIGVDFDFAIEAGGLGKKSTFAANAPGAGNLFNGSNNTNVNQNQTGVTPAYILNPQYSNSLGSKQPLVLGLGSSGDPNYFARQSASGQIALPFSQGSSDQIAPFNAIPGSGATFGIAFLSDLEVYLFVTALQGDTRSNLVQAPKVTTFNGALASINSANIINYVGALIPIVGAGAVAFQPIPSQINDGVFLFVTPVVSADRRYVRMTLSPMFNTFSGFDTISVPAAVGGGGLGGGATSVNATIQLPRITNNQVNTTVTVPDGGTVLLGGVKRLREERKEFGVPILSKTPLINRLFRNIGIGRETDSLMLMVTPRIIILEEEEERLGIPAVNNPNAGQ